MRNAVTLGLLAAALVPLSWDSTSHSQTPITTSTVTHTATDAHTELQSALFEIDRNSEIERSMRLVRQARELATAAATPNASRIETGSVDTAAAKRAAFAAERNAEILRSMAAYDTAREARRVAALNREIEASLARAKAYREATFTAARNAEARRSFVAYENARQELFAEAYRGEMARITARYAKLELAIARERNESLFAILGRLAPHIATAEAIASHNGGTNAIETASIARSDTVGVCATASP